MDQGERVQHLDGRRGVHRHSARIPAGRAVSGGDERGPQALAARPRQAGDRRVQDVHRIGGLVHFAEPLVEERRQVRVDSLPHGRQDLIDRRSGGSTRAGHRVEQGVGRITPGEQVGGRRRHVRQSLHLENAPRAEGVRVLPCPLDERRPGRPLEVVDLIRIRIGIGVDRRHHDGAPLVFGRSVGHRRPVHEVAQRQRHRRRRDVQFGARGGAGPLSRSDSPTRGWPQHALVHTDGQVRFVAARLVSNTRPAASTT